PSPTVHCLATLFVVSFASIAAWTQAQPFSHIVVVVQENRTPDNLFGSAPASVQCSGQDDFEPGVDIQDWGYINGSNHQCFTARHLADLTNPDHSHGGFSTMYHNGAMDGCKDGTTDCWSFVQKSEVQAYFDIAPPMASPTIFFRRMKGQVL